MSEQRVEAYAGALFEVAKAEGSLSVVEDELFKVARTLEANENLRSTLTDQAIPIDVRQGVVEDLLGQRAHPTTTALVSFLVASGRGRDLPAIIDKLVERAATERDEAVAEIRTAFPLEQGQEARLAAALAKATGKKLSVKIIIDPTVMGGVVARIGDTVIDGSIRHRLTQLRASL